MSKDMKLIMEGWRKYSAPQKTEQELLEESMKGLLGSLLLGFGLSYAPNAMGAGFEESDNPKMQVVADALELVAQKNSKLKGAAELAREIAKDPSKDNLTFGDLEVSQMADGYLVDQFASQIKSDKELKDLKLKVDKLQGKVSADQEEIEDEAKAEKEDDKETMQQRVRKANQDAFKAGTGGLGPMQ